MFRSGNFPGAERLAREALAADPNAGSAHTLLARALVEQGRAAAGLAAAQAALAIRPDAEAFHAQALAYLGMKRRTDAVAAAEQARRLAPMRASHANLLGIMLEENGRISEARTTLLESMRLAPGNDAFRASFGLFLLRHRALAEAEQVAAELSAESDVAEVLMLRGKLALLRHRPRQAQDFALWILSRNATNRQALGLLVAAKAGQSRVLGLWWRYNTFVASAPKWAVYLAATGLGLGLLVPGVSNLAVILLLYIALARRAYRWQLRRALAALRPVTLDKRF